jgi:hypothetical protein
MALFPSAGVFVVGKNHNADSDPKAEDTGHPDANEEAIFVTYEKPQGDAGEEADKCPDEERVVNFVKHK